MVLRWKRTHGFECFDQTGSVPQLTKEFRNARGIRRRENTPSTNATHTTSTLQPTPCCCFSRRHLQRGTNKEIAVFRSQLSVKQKVNCLHILYNGVSEHGSITTGRFLGPASASLHRGSELARSRHHRQNESSSTQCQTSPAERKSHEHAKLNFQSRRK